jgi:hypothetical protein
MPQSSLLVVLHGQAEVCDGALEILLDEDVGGLDVPVRDGRLAARARDLRVKVAQAGEQRVAQAKLKKEIAAFERTSIFSEKRILIELTRTKLLLK